MRTKKESDFEGCGDPPFTLEDWQFVEACKWHDKAYSVGSWHQGEFTRKEVDKHFLNQMLLIAGKNWRLKVRAYAYYGLARLFGSYLWEGKKLV